MDRARSSRPCVSIRSTGRDWRAKRRLSFQRQPADTNPLLATLAARNELASGHADKACKLVARASALKGSIPARLKGQTILMAGYCSAVQNDLSAAGLAADMAREEGVDTFAGSRSA